jgi:RimJ/RimL family protein N-acetyltransferase
MITALVIRAAVLDDADLLRAWRNEPETLRNSFDSRPIRRGHHLLWLERKLEQPENSRVWIAELDGRPVGQARVDRVDPAIGQISVSVAEGARGDGIGARLIEAATERAFAALGLTEIEARVKVSNGASVRAFRRAGFAERPEDRRGDEVLVLVRRVDS